MNRIYSRPRPTCDLNHMYLRVKQGMMVVGRRLSVPCKLAALILEFPVFSEAHAFTRESPCVLQRICNDR